MEAANQRTNQEQTTFKQSTGADAEPLTKFEQHLRASAGNLHRGNRVLAEIRDGIPRGLGKEATLSSHTGETPVLNRLPSPGEEARLEGERRLAYHAMAGGGASRKNRRGDRQSEGSNRFDSGAIKVLLGKKKEGRKKGEREKKRHARKEWNLIRNWCSLVFSGSHEETRQNRVYTGKCGSKAEKSSARQNESGTRLEWRIGEKHGERDETKKRERERGRGKERKHDNENYRGVHRLRRENVSDRDIVSEDITIRNMITRGGWMVTFASDLREDSQEPGETLTERDAEAR
ncbi:hypothetical protein K0M31_000432 [Melipona bicolor]|uniref:Uncharacterized protein n=1 Tax=Melipona bicolor TaxID=60889 RepID=A0AA40KWU2_9HYME|nr:hypothetical protein K0M31_000432 [Melipona bicolor]